MSFHLLIRRVHLYLGMFLLPWFFVYGVSSIPFSHAEYFQQRYGRPQWSVRFERPYHIEAPPGADLRPIGARILKDNGLDGAFGVYRPNERTIEVYRFRFGSATRLRYRQDEKRLVAEDSHARWNHLLTELHARGGFDQDSFLNDLWAVVVDMVSIGIVLWIATGIYMWWQLPQCRRWGWAALGGGGGLFVIFLATL